MMALLILLVGGTVCITLFLVAWESDETPRITQDDLYDAHQDAQQFDHLERLASRRNRQQWYESWRVTLREGEQIRHQRHWKTMWDGCIDQ